MPAWLRRLLAVPLLWKLAGANVLVGLVAVGAAAMLLEGVQQAQLVRMLGVALLLALLVNLLVVRLALRPLQAVERTADRVWRGDLGARVPRSFLADRDIARLGGTLNLLLDSMDEDRTRMRSLASRIIVAQDEERSRLARELHDSVAQTLTGLVLQIGAAQRDNTSDALAPQLALIRTIAGEALEEVRLLSHTVYPRVLDDLGLVAAIEWLARQSRGEGIAIDVEADPVPSELSAPAAATLYRVAQEAVRNATRHAGPSRVSLTLRPVGQEIILVVTDDGRGFDVADAETRRPGMGLVAMRERVALVDGRLEMDSAPGAGTRVTATVPLHGGMDT